MDESAAIRFVRWVQLFCPPSRAPRRRPSPPSDLARTASQIESPGMTEPSTVSPQVHTIISGFLASIRGSEGE